MPYRAAAAATSQHTPQYFRNFHLKAGQDRSSYSLVSWEGCSASGRDRPGPPPAPGTDCSTQYGGPAVLSLPRLTDRDRRLPSTSTVCSRALHTGATLSSAAGSACFLTRVLANVMTEYCQTTVLTALSSQQFPLHASDFAAPLYRLRPTAGNPAFLASHNNVKLIIFIKICYFFSRI